MHQSEQALASVHDGPWKLIAEGDFFAAKPDPAPKLQLYNLQADPGETTDVAGGHADIVAHLQAELRRFGALQKPGGVGYDFGREDFKAPKDWVIER